jgi:molecular chaperone DnaJ
VDFYDLLGVRRGAGPSEIRRAYQRLARRLHPAVNPGDPAAADTYREATVAFEILSDPHRRAAYDSGNLPRIATSTLVKGGFEGFDFSASVRVEKVGMRQIVDDVLRPAESPNAPTPGEHLTQSTLLTFDEALRGGRRRIHLVRQDHCPACDGTGELAMEPAKCPDCGGHGQVRASRGHMIFARRCGRCGGTGLLERSVCGRCEGEGRLAVSEWMEIQIPAGVASGSEVRLRGAGNVGRRRGSSGDFVLSIEVEPHPRFERAGDDLVTTAAADFVVAAMGGHVTVETPDGPVQIEVPAGTQNGQRFRLRKRGMPRLDGAGRGDLWVEMRVLVPVVTDDRARELLQALGERLAEVERT